jgi:hypothetical protein
VIVAEASHLRTYFRYHPVYTYGAGKYARRYLNVTRGVMGQKDIYVTLYDEGFYFLLGVVTAGISVEACPKVVRRAIAASQARHAEFFGGGSKF